MDTGVLVEYIEPQVELTKILDRHDLRTRHHVRKQVLVKWKDRLNKGFTWKRARTLQKKFLDFAFKVRTLKRVGIHVMTMVILLQGKR